MQRARADMIVKIDDSSKISDGQRRELLGVSPEGSLRSVLPSWSGDGQDDEIDAGDSGKHVPTSSAALQKHTTAALASSSSTSNNAFSSSSDDSSATDDGHEDEIRVPVAQSSSDDPSTGTGVTQSSKISSQKKYWEEKSLATASTSSSRGNLGRTATADGALSCKSAQSRNSYSFGDKLPMGTVGERKKSSEFDRALSDAKLGFPHYGRTITTTSTTELEQAALRGSLASSRTSGVGVGTGGTLTATDGLLSSSWSPTQQHLREREKFITMAESAVVQETLSHETFDPHVERRGHSFSTSSVPRKESTELCTRGGTELSSTQQNKQRDSSTFVVEEHSRNSSKSPNQTTRSNQNATKTNSRPIAGSNAGPRQYPIGPPSPPRAPPPLPPAQVRELPKPMTRTDRMQSSSSRSIGASTAGGTLNSSKFAPGAMSAPVGITPSIRPTKLDDLSLGMLPDVLMTMREKIESLSLFDSDMMKLISDSGPANDHLLDEDERASKESLRRSFQQSISAAVLVSLAHKRYERRRLAAMEIEKVVRSLVAQNELERVRAILLLLSDDYVRSSSEDARKGGVVALAACEIGLKKADSSLPEVMACKDLILASVVHACQDHSQRVRYYATESLFNVVKVIPAQAVQHFFILFEILRSLYADVDHDVRSGAQLLDKKFKEIIVAAINNGSFTVEACVPLFVRFVYMKNKPTKRLTLTWLQEFSEKLVGCPLLEFLHLFLSGVFAMVADPSSSIRQLALGFLQTVLPKLLVNNGETDQDVFEFEVVDDEEAKDEDGSGDGAVRSERGRVRRLHVDFDKILQSLVTIMEHPDPFVRKVAMYWTSQIVQTHVGRNAEIGRRHDFDADDDAGVSGVARGRKLPEQQAEEGRNDQDNLSAASISVRNSIPHVLPGILLSIGDAYHARTSASPRDAFFVPTQTTNSLAEQTNLCLQQVVRNDGSAFESHLDGFIVTLLEELVSPGGLGAERLITPAVDRKPYRMDVRPDGSGIESTGWFRTARPSESSMRTGEEEKTSSSPPSNREVQQQQQQYEAQQQMMMMSSRLCALDWIVVLYESVVPDSMKAGYAREFISPVAYQFVHNPPDTIIRKSLEVLAIITTPVSSEIALSCKKSESCTKPYYACSESRKGLSSAIPFLGHEWEDHHVTSGNGSGSQQMAWPSALPFARDRQMFAVLISLFSRHPRLLTELSSSRVLEYMCTLQNPEFVFLSFALEIDSFVLFCSQDNAERTNYCGAEETLGRGLNISSTDNVRHRGQQTQFAKNLHFVAAFVQQMNIVLLTAKETTDLRASLKDAVIGGHLTSNEDKRMKYKNVDQKLEEEMTKNKNKKLFDVLLHSFSHNFVAVLSLCLWGGAYRTASCALHQINPLDINLNTYLEIDQLVELLERPLFRHLHLRMLERDQRKLKTSSFVVSSQTSLDQRDKEGSGAMLFRTLKSILMLLPQSTSYNMLRDRLLTVAKFRQSAARRDDLCLAGLNKEGTNIVGSDVFINRICSVRAIHCAAKWQTIRSLSLKRPRSNTFDGAQIKEFQRSSFISRSIDGKDRMDVRTIGLESEKKEEIAGNDGSLLKDKISSSGHGPSTSSHSGMEKTQINPRNGQWKEFWTSSVDN